MTAAEGLARAEKAIGEANDRVRAEVFQRFKGGTLPPPPWPKHEALIKAGERLKVVRDGIAVLAKRAPDAKLAAKVVSVLESSIATVGAELDVLALRLDQAKARGDDLVSAAKALPAALGAGAFLWILAAFVVLDDGRRG